jgi:hypothetical protein
MTASLSWSVGVSMTSRLRLGGQAQALQDVVLDQGRGGGGQGDGGHVPEGPPHGAQAQVVGAEVVAPLGEAVRLVHGEQAQRGLGAGLEEAGREALRRHVDQLVVAAHHALDPRAALVDRQGRVDEGGAHLPRRQGVDLVLHQGEEWRDDQGGAAPRQRRQLVAERLPGARRHDDEGVPALGDVLDDGPLAVPEAREAEALAQEQVEVHHAAS